MRLKKRGIRSSFRRVDGVEPKFEGPLLGRGSCICGFIVNALLRSSMLRVAVKARSLGNGAQMPSSTCRGDFRFIKSIRRICLSYCMPKFRLNVLSESAMLTRCLTMTSAQHMCQDIQGPGRASNVQQPLLPISSTRRPPEHCAIPTPPARVANSTLKTSQISVRDCDFVCAFLAIVRPGRSFLKIPTRQRAYCLRHSFFRPTRILALIVGIDA